MSNPVCHVPPETIPADPKSRSLPGLGGPPQPNIPSLVNAVTNLQAVVRALSGQVSPISPQSRPSDGFRVKQDKPTKERWTEEARVMEKVRIYQNNDPTSGNYVDVERINRLTMVDKTTGEKWTWDRDRK